MGIPDDVAGKMKEAVGGGSGEHSALANEVPEAGLLQQGLNFLRSNLPGS